MNPDIASLSYSQSEHSNNVSAHGSSHRSIGSGDGSNFSEHGSNVSSYRSNLSGHGSSAHSSGVSNVSIDVSVNASTGLADFNDFLDDPEVANYNKIQQLKERYLYLQNSKFFN